MIHELAPEYRPAVRFLEMNPDQNLMMLRSLRMGARPGFAALVDNPDEASAVLLIERPDWKQPKPPPTRIQIDAVDIRSAVSLLSWLQPVAHVQICGFRPWLYDLLCSLFRIERVQQRVHCLVRQRQFRPSQSQHRVEEFAPDQCQLLAQVSGGFALEGGARHFGIREEDRLVACAALAQPDGEYVAVQGLYTREESRGMGHGGAVLSAATQAGLSAGKIVSYGLPIDDRPSLHLLASLGFAPACREWMIEGYPKR